MSDCGQAPLLRNSVMVALETHVHLRHCCKHMYNRHCRKHLYNRHCRKHTYNELTVRSRRYFLSHLSVTIVTIAWPTTRYAIATRWTLLRTNVRGPKATRRAWLLICTNNIIAAHPTRRRILRRRPHCHTANAATHLRQRPHAERALASTPTTQRLAGDPRPVEGSASARAEVLAGSPRRNGPRRTQ